MCASQNRFDHIFILLLVYLFLIICIMRQWTNLSFQLSIVCENVSHQLNEHLLSIVWQRRRSGRDSVWVIL